MRGVLLEIASYAGRVFHRFDFICGGVIAIVYLFVADRLGLSDHRTVVVVAIVGVAFTWASYAVYHEERSMRSKLEQGIRVTARLSGYRGNMPDPGPGRESLWVRVHWEIWVDRDITTEKLALNFIYRYERHWWQFWKKSLKPMIGIPPKGQDTTSYRKSIRAIDPQPFKDTAEFEYDADAPVGESPHWLLELVLVTGMPVGIYRVLVNFPFDELAARGAKPPL
jgi:hypothetical protein